MAHIMRALEVELPGCVYRPMRQLQAGRVPQRLHTMPVLANVLLSALDEWLSIIGANLEVELMATSNVSIQSGGDITQAQAVGTSPDPKLAAGGCR